MRRILLAGVAAAGLLAAQPSRADLPVIDAASIGHLLESIGIEGEMRDQLIQTYIETVQVYNMSHNIWNSVAEITGADQFAPELLDPSMRNPLPYTATQHPGWVGGYNDPSSLPFGSQFVFQNTVGGNPAVYTDGTFAGGEILKSIYSLSSMQAVSTNHLQSIEARIYALGDLFSRLGGIGTVQEADSLSARLHSELNYANSQVVQGQQAMSSAQMQLAVLENNQRQWAYQDENTGVAAMCANVGIAGSFVTIPACAGVGSGGIGNSAPATTTAANTGG